MKKYQIKYQDKNEIKEMIFETSNLSNEKLPINIIEINEYKNYFDFKYFGKKRVNDKKINLLFYELSICLALSSLILRSVSKLRSCASIDFKF